MDTCLATPGTSANEWCNPIAPNPKARCVPPQEGWAKVVGPNGFLGAPHRFVGNIAVCGLVLLPDSVDIMPTLYPENHPSLASDDRCPVCQRISDLEEKLRNVTARLDHLSKLHGVDWNAQPLGMVSDASLAKKLGVSLSETPRHHTIDWDDDSGINNRGSDGFGLIASCVVHGAVERIVQLNFTYYAQDTDDEPISDLTALCQDISDMIHERLD